MRVVAQPYGVTYPSLEYEPYEPVEGDIFHRGPMTEKELEEMEQELGPRPPAVSPLAIVWEDAQAKGQSEIKLADIQNNNLYSVSLVGDRIVVYPILLQEIPRYDQARTIEPKGDGSPDWETVYNTFFPGGYTEVPAQPAQTAHVYGSQEIPKDFWRKVLIKALNKKSHNPYK
jgi:hypothetical protein